MEYTKKNLWGPKYYLFLHLNLTRQQIIQILNTTE